MDTDTWWHLRAGEWITTNKTIPQVDTFSYTRYGEAWRYPGWLVELPMYGIYQLFGYGGLNLWTAFMITLTFAFLWPVLSGGIFLRAFCLIMAATASGVYWSARPHLVTLMLSAIFVLILEKNRWRQTSDGFKAMLWLPFIMILWANSHGGFIMGFILLAAYTIEPILAWRFRGVPDRRLQFMLGCGFAMLGAVCISPAGISMLLYPFQTVNISALQGYIQEWQSPNFHELSVQPFAWLLLIGFGVVGISPRRNHLTDLVLFCGLAWMGLMAGRNIALFALAAPVVISRYAEPLVKQVHERWLSRLVFTEQTTTGQKRLNGMIFTVLCSLVILKAASVYPEGVNLKYLEEQVPFRAVEYIRETKPAGRLFNSYNWGGYLLWALPEYPVFVDGRTDLYNDELIDQWLLIVRAQDGWQDLLAQWQVNLILLEPTMPVTLLLEQNGWKEIYQDELAVLYAR